MKCMKCGYSDLPDNAKFCRSCGSSTAAEPSQPAEELKNAEPDKWKSCPSCGFAPLPLNANFCRGCGANVKELSQAEPLPEAKVASAPASAPVSNAPPRLESAPVQQMPHIEKNKSKIFVPIIAGVVIALSALGYWGYQQKVTADRNAEIAAIENQKRLDEQQRQLEEAKRKEQEAQLELARQYQLAEQAKREAADAQKRAEAERQQREEAIRAQQLAEAERQREAELKKKNEAAQGQALQWVKRLDGNWYSKQWKYGYQLKDGVGTATVTNSPNFQVGQRIIQLSATSNTTFTGQQVYTDGKFYKIDVTLLPDGRLYFEGEKNSKWYMERLRDKVSAKVDLFFAVDQTDITPEGQKLLDQVVAYTRKVELDAIVLQGYSALIGSDANSLDISRRRAAAAKSYLVSRGVDANRIQIEGKGTQNPQGDNNTPAGRAKNNRVFIEIIGYKPN